MQRYFIWTIGCQMNKAESHRIANYLTSAGYEVSATHQDADLIVLNTCVVRQSAEDRVLGTLSLLKGFKETHPSTSVLVTGCFVDFNVEELKKRFPQVDLFFKPGDYSELTDWLHRAANSPSPFPLPSRERVRMTVLHASSSPCAFVPIIQGCNNFCSYCIVPYRRGREISLPMDEIVCEVEELVRRGTREVTLLGQNVDSYGHDLPEKPDLADLIAKLNDIAGLFRIRFLTNHPKDMSLKLIGAMASLDKVCQHLELPVQSGDDEILNSMRRGYTVEQYSELVCTIRSYIPESSLSTDVIVGFPEETEEQFDRTLSLLGEIKFDVVHAAAYSPRPGTIAWRECDDNVPSEIKKMRLNKIEILQSNIAAGINSKLQGNIMEVLVEGKKREKWYGRTRSNKLVFFESSKRSEGSHLGQLVEVRIQRTSPWSMQGELAVKSYA